MSEAPAAKLGSSGLRDRIPAGVLDAALASLATFVTGLVAVNVFDDKARGVYALFFVAFGFGQVIAHNVVYIPAEIFSVADPLGSRLASLRHSLELGSMGTAVGSLAALLAAAVTWNLAQPELIIPLTITCAAAIFLSPSQDHVRQMLHIDGASWFAVAVSAVQLAAAVIAMGVMLLLDVPVAWLPFGALAIANAASLTAGVLLARHHGAATGLAVRHSLSEMLDAGKWLLLGSIVPAVAAFLAGTIIIQLAGEEALGFADAARIAAQPVLVLAMGLNAVISPRVMEAAIARDAALSRRVTTAFSGLLILGAAGYLLVAGWAWPLNPMRYLVAPAFEIGGLVAVSIAANVLIGFLFYFSRELTAARKEKAMAGVSFIAAPMRLLGASTAATTGAFARPIAVILSAATSLTAYVLLRRNHYRPVLLAADADPSDLGDPG